MRIINPDDFLQTPAGRVWTPERSAEAWEACYRALEECVMPLARVARVVLVCGVQGAGKTHWIAAQPDHREEVVYFDAALPGARHRRPIVAIARRHGVPIDAVLIRVPLQTALDRNARRAADIRVPEEAVRLVAERFEAPTPEEGFGRIRIVDGTGGAARFDHLIP